MVQEARGCPCITELAAGFGGGIGGEQDVCGAVTGGVIAISYQAGQAGGNQEEIAKRAKPGAVALYRAFQEQYGTVNCRALIGYDYRDPSQYEKGHADPERIAKCNRFKEFAIRRILEEDL